MFSRLLRFVRDEWDRLWFGRPVPPPEPPRREQCALCYGSGYVVGRIGELYQAATPCPLCEASGFMETVR